MTFQLESIGYCSVVVSFLLTGANLDFLLGGGAQKNQHSEKTEEMQVNPNQAGFLVCFYLNHICAELRGDSGIHLSKYKAECLAVKCHILPYCNTLDKPSRSILGIRLKNGEKKNDGPN